MKHFKSYLFTLLCVGMVVTSQSQTKEYDLCIYGGTSAGVVAAYTASKAGKSVILVDPGQMLGGLSSGGLGQTDIGNKYVVRGLALDFYRKIGKHYGGFEQWIFEPKVAEGLFKQYMENCEAEMHHGQLLLDVEKNGTDIKLVRFQSVDGLEKPVMVVKAKVYMDCTYEGDLFAAAGVSYHIGREANNVYGETINGVQLMKGHQFPDGVDPYVERGNAASGLLWGIRDGELQPDGTGDKKVQAYNFRIALTNVPENRVPITQPDNYDPSRYELLRRQKEIQPWKALTDVFIWSLMPNGKTDINNRNGFSTDMIGANWDYPEADYKRRQEIIKAHEDYTKGLLYFVGNDLSVPEFIRKQMKEWGYPKDEYVDNGHWSPQLYIREARRMVGELVMTQHHCQGREIVDDEVGWAAYTMDSHNCDRLVVNGMVKNEGNVEVGGFPPFPIAYRSIVPKREEVTNLLVPVCLSASHIAFGSIRMEPVFMVLGQSAAVAACLAIDGRIPVQQVDVNSIKAELAANPKADGRQPDMIISSTDKNAVHFTGTWKESNRKGYGPTYVEANSDVGVSTARFVASDLKPGSYHVYTYFPKTSESASQFPYMLASGEQVSEKILNLSEIEIKGQTSSTWVSLGELHVKAEGNETFVELSTKGADGSVAANAVLFVPVDDQTTK
ncbi:FAD-dependent oxidoreductase [Sphingobacterium sp. SGR-19]|uniref:FAD-dependent oxidoreductase n=1 Tax=Sphingobacterium sp. SGR-19 TaxID=2710886 RepID=UPI0013EB03A0|nr:FAD-dependent oxidoreductase [Sphingobacterium sp. SGR-19]NGM65255.1 FAD-dependent oxidoreductase [Sphingobacterium sp. SGR-19]